MTLHAAQYKIRIFAFFFSLHVIKSFKRYSHSWFTKKMTSTVLTRQQRRVRINICTLLYKMKELSLLNYVWVLPKYCFGITVRSKSTDLQLLEYLWWHYWKCWPRQGKGWWAKPSFREWHREERQNWSRRPRRIALQSESSFPWGLIRNINNDLDDQLSILHYIFRGNYIYLTSNYTFLLLLQCFAVTTGKKTWFDLGWGRRLLGMIESERPNRL